MCGFCLLDWCLCYVNQEGGRGRLWHDFVLPLFSAPGWRCYVAVVAGDVPGSRRPCTDTSKLSCGQRRESWRCPSQLDLGLACSPHSNCSTSSVQITSFLQKVMVLVSGSCAAWDICGACSPTADCASWSMPVQVANFSGGEVSYGGSSWPVKHWLLLPQVLHQPTELIILMDVFWVPRYLVFRSVFSALWHTFFLLNFQALLSSSWRRS